MEKRDRKRKKERKKSLMGWAVGRPMCVSPTVDHSAVMGLPQPKAFILQRNFPLIQICA